jgi:hypothetical protein
MNPAEYLAHAAKSFRQTKSLADKALAQVDDVAFFRALDAESNSPALLVKHVAGNLISRWTDFLTTDGEKPDRNRDAEFLVDGVDTRASLTARWESGWSTLFATLDALAPADIDRTVVIRNEPHTVFDAIERQKTHYAYHVGQIVFVAKHLAGAKWASLSVPRGGSDAFNEKTKSEEFRRSRP